MWQRVRRRLNSQHNSEVYLQRMQCDSFLNLRKRNTLLTNLNGLISWAGSPIRRWQSLCAHMDRAPQLFAEPLPKLVFLPPVMWKRSRITLPLRHFYWRHEWQRVRNHSTLIRQRSYSPANLAEQLRFHCGAHVRRYWLRAMKRAINALAHN